METDREVHDMETEVRDSRRIGVGKDVRAVDFS